MTNPDIIRDIQHERSDLLDRLMDALQALAGSGAYLEAFMHRCPDMTDSISERIAKNRALLAKGLFK